MQVVQAVFIMNGLSARRGRHTGYHGTIMSLTPHDFDPLAIIVDWLDACRAGDLDSLLDLYDQNAILECDCESVSLTGRAALSSYWANKLRSQLAGSFTLDDLTVTGDGVWAGYRNHKGSLVRAHFRFSSSGKIQRTRCGPLHQRLSA